MTLPPGAEIAGGLADDGRPPPDVVVEPDADVLARAVASALVARLAAAQAVHGTASVVLTGGGIGIALLEHVAALAAEPARERVDWTAVDVWWGDERFVPADSDDRNEKAARRALLDAVGVPPERVHAMPPSDGEFAEPEDAAAWYAEQLAAAAPAGAAVPRFDVLILGMGPEGHTASIFPESPAAHDDRPAFAVRGCPKPPPTRVSLGFSAINTAEEVWMVVAGEEKAPAVAMALSGSAGPVQLPAAGVHGTRATRWLLDSAAAGKLPGRG
ncbi:6-phosphogluconolactonase [Geodermatophilus sp. YIM 151500]|uniref:6-phosphogluconolactonase n=1 Tax=Geodermatophilus sp. YIM 151500 TaxID=2984531 RepID=UPI0021E4478D|nr:6-phosphogluconolactonase [Geodermatophilus sp. YIM 151500]MCV2488009.1 6-phosphogluconolactonase [Geodermatophilus sp. YIM 151500]